MRTSLLLAVFFIGGASLQAQTVVSPPTGYVTTGTCLANSDTLVSLPFSRPPEFVGSIASVSGSTLTISGTLGWQDNQFVYGTTLVSSGSTQHNHYYALIGTRQIALSGSVSLTSGTNLVTGVGTTFTSQVSAGDGLILTGSTDGYYIVQSVSDNTDLILTGTARNTLTGQSASVSKSVKEGYTYLVTANSTDGTGASTVAVDLNGDDISAIAAGTQVSLIPYWTLATVFPPSDVNVSYIPTTSSRSQNLQTQILIPNYQYVGVNGAANPNFYIYWGPTSAWQIYGSGAGANNGDDIFLPDGYFIIRNAATPTTLTVMGSVNMQRLAIPLTTGTSLTTRQDNFVSITRPVPVTLNDLNLIASGAFTPTTSSRASNVEDQLFLYDNTATGTNKGALNDYIYKGGMWQILGAQVITDKGGDVVPAGAAIVIRKAGASGPTATFWTNPPNY